MSIAEYRDDDDAVRLLRRVASRLIEECAAEGVGLNGLDRERLVDAGREACPDFILVEAGSKVPASLIDTVCCLPVEGEDAVLLLTEYAGAAELSRARKEAGSPVIGRGSFIEALTVRSDGRLEYGIGLAAQGFLDSLERADVATEPPEDEGSNPA